jgi:hypothetical protein
MFRAERHLGTLKRVLKTQFRPMELPLSFPRMLTGLLKPFARWWTGSLLLAGTIL